jgi:Protein of unknown function (DUF3025)
MHPSSTTPLARLAHLCGVDPLFASIRQLARDIRVAEEVREAWPSVDELQAIVGPRLRSVREDLRLVLQARKPRRTRSGRRPLEARYEVQVARTGAIPTRFANAHDLFNALCWGSFPASKLALAERLARSTSAMVASDAQGRTLDGDAIAMIDEGGLLLVATPDRYQDAERAQRASDHRALFELCTPWALGHALLEHVFLERPGELRAYGIVLSVAQPSELADVDRALAAWLPRTQLGDRAPWRAVPLAAWAPRRA